MITCPLCRNNQFTQLVGELHYICVKDESVSEGIITGCGHQFHIIEDAEIKFPYNVIYPNKTKKDFYRKPPLTLSPINESIN